MPRRGRGTKPFFTLKSAKTENFILLWGCRSTHTVLANTKMIQDIIDELGGKIDPEMLSIQLPRDLEHLIGEDAQFEMLTSNTL